MEKHEIPKFIDIIEKSLADKFPHNFQERAISIELVCLGSSAYLCFNDFVSRFSNVWSNDLFG